MIFSPIANYFTTYYTQARPSIKDFEVSVICRAPGSDNKVYRSYSIDHIDTIGTTEGEPFELCFKNKSSEDVSIKWSLDGTDVITGKPASLEATTDCFIVRAGNSLNLKAWHESSNGGSRFVFTTPEKGVALNLNKDDSHRGIIACAVFVEQEAPKVVMQSFTTAYSASSRIGGSFPESARRSKSINTYDSDASITSNSLGATVSDISDIPAESDGFKSLAVGAGEYVEQKTKTVKGLDKPVLCCVSRTRYCSTTELESRVIASRDVKASKEFPTGFPGTQRSFIDLTSVPKTESSAKSTVERFV